MNKHVFTPKTTKRKRLTLEELKAKRNYEKEWQERMRQEGWSRWI